MNILIATGIYPPEIGGPATYTVLLEQELPKHGHVVTVVPFAVSRSLPKIFRHMHYAWSLLKKTRGIDVIFAQDVASVGFPALVVASMTRKTFFVRVPGDYAWEQSVQRFSVTDTIDDFQKNTYGLKIEFLRYLQTTVTKFADQVITPSNYFRELVAGWGVSKEKIVTIYNGVDLNTKPSLVEKPAAFTIVSAGRIVPWKGFMTLCDIVQDNPKWHLVVLGDGPLRSEYEKSVAEAQVEDRIQFRGSVSREEIFGWCAVADAFVLNTEFESFSYQLVEAMSVGAAIITTNVGSIPELITDGVEGVLLSPHDTKNMTLAIKSITSEPETWSARKIAAKEKAKMFSIAATVEQLVNVLKRYE